MNGYEWRDAILSDTCPLERLTMLVLLFIAKHMNGSKDMAWPTQETIGKNLRISVSTVKRRLKEAESAGWVTITRPKYGSRRANEYTASLPLIAMQPSIAVLPSKPVTGAEQVLQVKSDTPQVTMDELPIPISNPNQESSKSTKGMLGKEGLPSASKGAAPPAPRQEEKERKMKTPIPTPPSTSSAPASKTPTPPSWTHIKELFS
jgi:DNA-binding Lrp family transcriptional regulator